MTIRDAKLKIESILSVVKYNTDLLRIMGFAPTPTNEDRKSMVNSLVADNEQLLEEAIRINVDILDAALKHEVDIDGSKLSLAALYILGGFGAREMIVRKYIDMYETLREDNGRGIPQFDQVALVNKIKWARGLERKAGKDLWEIEQSVELP